MKLRTSSFCALSLALACVPAHAQTGTPASAGHELPAELRGAQRVLDAFHGALRSGDRKAALALLAEDALIYESGHAERKSEYAAHHLDADIAFAKEVPRTTLKRSGGRAGQLAWLTSEGRTAGTYKGRALDQRTVETALLRYRAGKWAIVHLHWSSAAAK
jgi:ketosteroid isomerase-like protein